MSWDTDIDLLRRTQHSAPESTRRKIEKVEKAIREANTERERLEKHNDELEGALKDIEARYSVSQDRLLLHFDKVLVQLGVFLTPCDFGFPNQHFTSNVTLPPAQGDPGMGRDKPDEDLHGPRSPTRQLARAVYDRGVELDKINAEFDEHQFWYDQQLEDYIISQVHRPDDDEVEKEFGQIWFQRCRDMTRKLIDAEKAYKDAKNMAEAAGIIFNPPDQGLDESPDAPPQQSISSRKRKRIEDWVDCNNALRSSSGMSLRSNPSATWSAKEGHRDLRQRIDDYNKRVGRER
jgi:hypothetical protein